MKKLCLILFLPLFISCKKNTTGNDDDPNTSVKSITFSEHSPSSVSAVPVTFFVTNRKGTAFIITVISANGKTETFASKEGKTWDKLGEFTPVTAVVTETGAAIYFENSNILKRYTGGGAPETITSVGNNHHYHRIHSGLDGNIYLGSANNRILKSSNDGLTWEATDIPVERFCYNGQLPIAFFAFAGKMSSYSDKSLYTSTDGGKVWQKQNFNPDLSNSGFVDRYAGVNQDLFGSAFINGASGVSVIDMANQSSKSISYQSAGLKPDFEQFHSFTTDMQGNLYATINSFGYDYEYAKTGGAIYKYTGNTWQKHTLPNLNTGFNGMAIYGTQAGIISAANGLQSKGLYSLGSSGQFTEIGITETVTNQITAIAPHTAGKVFAVVKHPSNSKINPSYKSLLLLSNGEWKYTGLSSDMAFVSSSGTIYSIQNREIGMSKDGGNTWQKSTLVVQDPLNLRNLVAAAAVHFTELNGKVYIYMQVAFGGVGGIYTNYAWTSANEGTLSFESLLADYPKYRPDTKQIPLVTGKNAQVGFLYKPFNTFTYYPAVKEDVLLTKDGGVSFAPVDFPLPFAGSNSGTFVAFGNNGFMMSSSANPAQFTPMEVKINGGVLDFNALSGVNYFTPWGRFGPDNKLYMTLGNKIYVSDKSL